MSERRNQRKTYTPSKLPDMLEIVFSSPVHKETSLKDIVLEIEKWMSQTVWRNWGHPGK